MSPEISALVLAGGDGTRLQEFTRRLTGTPMPKQYCRIASDQSLLESTLARVGVLTPPERTFVIVNRNHLSLAAAQLHGLPAENVVVQPKNLDTGPGLLLSLVRLARQHPTAGLAVFPSDHHVADDDAFMASVTRAVALLDALPDKIILLGIRPDRPEPGYGYVEPAAPVTSVADPVLFHVRAFREKPSAAQAAEIVGRGGLWNSFVMVFRLKRMLRLLASVRPQDLERLWDVPDDTEALANVYDSLPPWNFSRDFLAHTTEHQVVLRVEDVGWSDWGTPEAIERTLAAGLTPGPPGS